MRNETPPDPIDIALREDIGPGDITTQYFVPSGIPALGCIVARGRAVIAGTGTAADVFRRVDSKMHLEVLQADGAVLSGGETILQVHGEARSILIAERVALNFLQRLSGIATLTRQFVEAAASGHAQILDTRKTTPGLRELEKAAVVAGGGVNHRRGLYDMILVKDNHLSAINGLSELARTIERIREEHREIRIEVEAETLEQVREFLEIAGVDIILLDNMKPSTLREAVALRRGKRVKFEASGGVTLKNIRQIAATGVDYISVGALTHSAPAIDFSLELTHAAN